MIRGVSVGGGQLTNTGRAQEYLKAGQAHASWIRTELNWSSVEPTQGTFTWVFDPVVTDIQSAGCGVIAVLHAVPDWANGGTGPYGMPTDSTLMQNYAYRTAKHYLPRGVTNFQIGNEVNGSKPNWTPTGTYYTSKMFAPIFDGIHQATHDLGIPATIFFGSLVPDGATPSTFVSTSYTSMAQKYHFDTMTFHPYCGNPETDPQFNTIPASVYSVMVAHGDGAKKMWATEFGAPTAGPISVTEAQQADLVTRAYNTWAAKSYTGPLLWYSVRDTGTDPNDREQHFGLLRYDFTEKPSYSTYKNLP